MCPVAEKELHLRYVVEPRHMRLCFISEQKIFIKGITTGVRPSAETLYVQMLLYSRAHLYYIFDFFFKGLLDYWIKPLV